MQNPTTSSLLSNLHFVQAQYAVLGGMENREGGHDSGDLSRGSFAIESVPGCSIRN